MADLLFTINGTDYPIADVPGFINSLTIDECRVYHEWTGSYIEEIAQMNVNSMMIAAFMQIVYMRGNPGIAAHTARDAVGASNVMEAFARFNASVEDDAGPPAVTPSEPAPNGSPGNNNDSQNTSGDGSVTHLAARATGPKHGGSPPLGVTATSGSPTSGSSPLTS